MMNPLQRFWPLLVKRLRQVTLFQRIALGNALIIVAGAVVGTLVTRHLARAAADWPLIGLLAGVGVLISLGFNFLILNAALQPLRDLRTLAARLRSGQGSADLSLHNPDPDITELAATLNTLVAQLEERHQQLRAISERAINAQEAERQSIARSLHDDTGQAFSMLLIHLDCLSDRLPPEREDLKKKTADARSLAANSLAELRRIVFGLRPSLLDDLGLLPALRWYARTNLEAAGIKVEFSTPETLPELDPGAATTLFRVAQEAINNIVRHSRAGAVKIAFAQEAEQVCLRVEDDGVGFDPAQVAGEALSAQHLGLLGLRERVELLDGMLRLESAPGNGTRLEASLPLSSTILSDGQNPHPAGR